MADDFTPPGRSEDYPAHPQGLGVLTEQLRDLRTTLADLPHGLLRQAGISVEPDTIRFGGNVAIEGTLSLPAGIIDNDALSNPLVSDTDETGVNNYAITTSVAVRATINFTVPAGFTAATVISTATAMGYNNTASPDYLYVQSIIDGFPGGELYSAAQAGFGVGISVPFNRSLTGLTGGQVIPVSVTTRTSSGTWTATVSNQANIYALVLFTR